jgi:hypothetical protein
VNDIFGANRLRYCNIVPQEQSVVAPAAALVRQSGQPDTSKTLATYQEQSVCSGDITNLKKDQAAASMHDLS